MLFHSWFSWMKTTFGVVIRHPNSLKKIGLSSIVKTMRSLKQYIASCTMSLFMNLLFCSKWTQLVWSLKLTTSYSMYTKPMWPSMSSLSIYGLMFILLHLVITISPSNEINLCSYIWTYEAMRKSLVNDITSNYVGTLPPPSFKASTQ